MELQTYHFASKTVGRLSPINRFRSDASGVKVGFCTTICMKINSVIFKRCPVRLKTAPTEERMSDSLNCEDLSVQQRCKSSTYKETK